MPAAGALIASNRLDELNRELQKIRMWSLTLVLGMTGVILAPASVYLAIFGDYHDAGKIMIALALAPIIRSIFVGIDVALKMTGRAGYSALVSIAAALAVGGVSLLLAPLIGIYSLAVGMFVSAAAINPVVAYLLSGSGISIVNKDGIIIAVTAVVGAAMCLFINNQALATIMAGLWLLLILILSQLWRRLN